MQCVSVGLFYRLLGLRTTKCSKGNDSAAIRYACDTNVPHSVFPLPQSRNALKGPNSGPSVVIYVVFRSRPIFLRIRKFFLLYNGGKSEEEEEKEEDRNATTTKKTLTFLRLAAALAASARCLNSEGRKRLLHIPKWMLILCQCVMCCDFSQALLWAACGRFYFLILEHERQQMSGRLLPYAGAITNVYLTAFFSSFSFQNKK